MKKEIGIEKTLEEAVAHYAKLTKESGLDGVVVQHLKFQNYVKYAEMNL